MKKLPWKVRFQVRRIDKEYRRKLLKINSAVIELVEWIAANYDSPAALLLIPLKSSNILKLSDTDLKLLGEFWEEVRSRDPTVIPWKEYLVENNKRSAAAFRKAVLDTRDVLVKAGVPQEALQDILPKNDRQAPNDLVTE